METSPFHVTAARLHHVEQTITLHMSEASLKTADSRVCVCVSPVAAEALNVVLTATLSCVDVTLLSAARGRARTRPDRERERKELCDVCSCLHSYMMVNVTRQQEGDTADNHTAGLCAASRGRSLYTHCSVNTVSLSS